MYLSGSVSAAHINSTSRSLPSQIPFPVPLCCSYISLYCGLLGIRCCRLCCVIYDMLTSSTLWHTCFLYLTYDAPRYVAARLGYHVFCRTCHLPLRADSLRPAALCISLSCFIHDVYAPLSNVKPTKVAVPYARLVIPLSCADCLMACFSSLAPLMLY
jgi:hypothetical protein